MEVGGRVVADLRADLCGDVVALLDLHRKINNPKQFFSVTQGDSNELKRAAMNTPMVIQNL